MPPRTHRVESTPTPPAAVDLTAFRGIYGADWRYQLSHILTGRLLDQADDYVRACRQYQLFLRGDDEDASARAAEWYPAIAAAYALQGSPLKRATVQLMVTAEMSAAEITERTRLPADHLAAWEAIYFDLRSPNRSPQWFQLHVLRPLSNAGDSLHAAQLTQARATGASYVRELLDAEDSLHAFSFASARSTRRS